MKNWLNHMKKVQLSLVLNIMTLETETIFKIYKPDKEDNSKNVLVFNRLLI